MARKTRTRIATVLVAGLAAASLLVAMLGDEAAEGGRDAATLAAQTARPGIEAYFQRESYRPGDIATLVVDSRVGQASIQVFRVGDAPASGRRYELRGVPVTARRQLVFEPGSTRSARVTIGAWPSGMYYSELRTADGRVGYATFVLAPRRLGEHRVAIVMPTNTWFAYNERDGDANGVGDTWYEDDERTTVDTTRPFLDRGVPPHFGHYDFGFLRWLFLGGRAVDVLSQRELEREVTGEELARAYDLIVFPGHHEYVTAHEFDVVERYRDLGGNLMFLSANNFYYKVTKAGDVMTRVGRWRDLGRPEAALTGVGFIRFVPASEPYVVQRAPAAPWVFALTGRGAGSQFGKSGIEVDGTTIDSPKGTQVLAEIPDLAGSGATAQMTYYETTRGAKVFAAGAFTLAGAALWPDVSRVLANLWSRLATEQRAG